MLWNALSLLGGFALGWWHMRRSQSMLESMLGQPTGQSVKRLVFKAGISRHIFTLLAGVLLIRVAGFEPFRLLGGMLIATMAYRVYVVRRRERI